MTPIRRAPNAYLLAANTARARAYADSMKRAGLHPTAAFLLDAGDPPAASVRPYATPLFDNETPLGETLDAMKVPTLRFETADVNAPEVCAALGALDPGIAIFAPSAGRLARAPLFATGHRFLHVHPGRLPDYRGSTPMYYSLIAERKIGATAIFLEPEIDVGPVLAYREFALPEDVTTIDAVYDPFIRATLLCEVLSAERDGRPLVPRAQNRDGVTFHVIHPVLKHIALLGGVAATGQRT